jgi:hypothetical protein
MRGYMVGVFYPYREVRQWNLFKLFKVGEGGKRMMERDY